MDSFLFKYKQTDGSKVLLKVVLFSGLFFAFTSASKLALLLCVIAFFFIITDKALIVDITNKRYKRARLFRNKVMGSWKPFPSVSYISVFKTTMVNKSTSLSGISMVQKEKVVMINLIHHKNRRLNIYQTIDVEEAIEKAKVIALTMDLPIYDATSKNGKWL